MEDLKRKLNLGCGEHKKEWFVNLDKNTGWCFEDKMEFPDNSVDGITISHAIMYVKEEDYQKIFDEYYRILKPGGVIRITEDSTGNPKSERFGGYHDAVTLTTPEMIIMYLLKSGFSAKSVRADESQDKELIQDLHGGEPKCFFVEGIK
jgi:SAM-dependent methyltransferase